MERNNNTGVMVVVGIVAILGLILAWSAFNRSGEDVVPTVAEEADEAARELDALGNELEQEAEDAERSAEVAAARAEARAELLAIEARLEAEEASAEIAQDIAAVRADLQSAYANASAEARQEWRELDADLETFEQNVRSGTAGVLETVAGFIALLGADVRSDDDEVSATTSVNSSIR